MRLVDDYHLFLFDFDGLLVNTEELHYEAYKQMCSLQGFALPWDFAEYTIYAHDSSESIKKGIYGALPGLYAKEPCWEVLHAEKKRSYMDLLNRGSVSLMPGVKELLHEIKAKGKKRCVVTHSPLEQIKMIRSQNPLLDMITHWITREDYAQPKPNPECYLKAIRMLASPSDKTIGFEDTPRGLRALLGTSASPVLVSPNAHPLLKEISQKSYRHIPSFLALCN
jgi:HAD superfamily hydrolase (TIGR01509 family)